MLLFVKREHRTQKNHDELYWNKSLWKKKLRKVIEIFIFTRERPGQTHLDSLHLKLTSSFLHYM